MKTSTLKYLNGKSFGLAAALAAVAVTGCYNPDGSENNTGTGALVGAGSGAAIGAIAANGSHRAGEGALIGAGAGALLGAIIGSGADRAQQAHDRQVQEYQRAQAGTPLSIADVKALAKAQVNDDTIIVQIVNSHTIYHLGANDIIDLRDAGVSQKVIDFMISTPSTISAAPAAVSVAAAPPPPPVEPVPMVSPGPGYVWVGGEWVWNGGWYWRAGYWDVPPGPGVIWVGGYWGRGPRGWERHGGHWEHR
jgi:hypothetical protein